MLSYRRGELWRICVNSSPFRGFFRVRDRCPPRRVTHTRTRRTRTGGAMALMDVLTSGYSGRTAGAERPLQGQPGGASLRGKFGARGHAVRKMRVRERWPAERTIRSCTHATNSTKLIRVELRDTSDSAQIDKRGLNSYRKSAELRTYVF